MGMGRGRGGVAAEGSLLTSRVLAGVAEVSAEGMEEALALIRKVRKEQCCFAQARHVTLVCGQHPFVRFPLCPQQENMPPNISNASKGGQLSIEPDPQTLLLPPPLPGRPDHLTYFLRLFNRARF